MKRNQLLAATLAALAAVRSSPGDARTAALPVDELSRDAGTLVLPGGGARGAYEAGVIEGVRQRGGIADGAPLPGVDAVAGTSIGSINGWFVATAQYAKLRRLWEQIASEQIFEIKRRYRATVTPSAGVLTRVFQAALVSQGLTSNVTGLLDGTLVSRWLARNVDPATPLVVPFVFTLTNLEHQRSEVFYRIPAGIEGDRRDAATRNLRSLFGSRIAVREVEDRFLVAALAGSSAIPIIFDPVRIDFPTGPLTYIDGGVADSAPLDLARAVSNRVQLILVDPAQAPADVYPNAAAVGTVAFSIAQNRVLEASLRGAYLETAGKRLFGSASLTPAQQAFFANVFDVEISLIRPAAELPVAVAGFDDAAGIAATYDLGVRAGRKGFVPYDPGAALR